MYSNFKFIISSSTLFDYQVAFMVLTLMVLT